MNTTENIIQPDMTLEQAEALSTQQPNATEVTAVQAQVVAEQQQEPTNQTDKNGNQLEARQVGGITPSVRTQTESL